MNSSALLQLQLAKKLECSRIGYASGPTGPTGPVGNTGPTGPAGYPKVYTFFLDFSATSPYNISRIYIPPGFSTDPDLAPGGAFTRQAAPPGLVFGPTSITISNTKYTFPVGLTITGYCFASNTSGYWAPSSRIGTAYVYWNIPATNTATITNTLNLYGLSLGNFNGNNFRSKYYYAPDTGEPDSIGWLATLTLYYL
jgi:hypothetical protein